MNNTIWAAPLVALALIACGGDETDIGNSGSGGGSTTTSSSAGGAGGSTSSAGGIGGMGDGCTGITPERTVLTPEELLSMLDNKDFVLINVHVPYAGEIPGTDTHIAYTDVDAIEAYLSNNTGANVVLYCRTGPMSEIAGDELVARGYCGVQDMAAGSYQWEQLGYPYTP
jgi:rhodanese-related sulfurtransferase